jgi:hypothetical protein
VQVLEQVVDVEVGDVERVDPHAKHLSSLRKKTANCKLQVALPVAQVTCMCRHSMPQH